MSEMPYAEAWAAFAKTARPLSPNAVSGKVLALVPHADDEVLGFGGLYRELLDRNVAIDIVLVTDGVGSHPKAAGHNPGQRRRVREAEIREAVRRLGGQHTQIEFWRKPDTQLPHLPAARRRRCISQVAKTIRGGSYATVLTPWRRDPHGDHRAITEWVLAALPLLESTERPTLLEYCVWLGHQGSAADFPAAGTVDLVKVDVQAHKAAKRHALDAHQSQLGGVFDDPDGFTIPASLAAATQRDYEYFLRS